MDMDEGWDGVGRRRKEFVRRRGGDDCNAGLCNANSVKRLQLAGGQRSGAARQRYVRRSYVVCMWLTEITLRTDGLDGRWMD